MRTFGKHLDTHCSPCYNLGQVTPALFQIHKSTPKEILDPFHTGWFVGMLLHTHNLGFEANLRFHIGYVVVMEPQHF